MMLIKLLRDLFRSSRSSAMAKPAQAGKSSFLPKYSTPDANRVTNFFYSVFWGTRDEAAVSGGLEAVVKNLEPGYHFADNMLTWARNLSMFDDAPFVKAWEANIESPSDKAIVWRRYVLACAAYHCAQL